MALDYKSSLSRYRRYLQLVQSQPLWTASLWVILSLILLIALLVLALRPTLVTISGLVGQIKQQEEISQKLEEKMITVQKALEGLDAISPKMPLLDEVLPKQSEWDILASRLEKIATESGLQVTSIVIEKIPLAFGTPVPTGTPVLVESRIPEGILAVKFIISASGEYTQIRKMVLDLENLRRVIVLSSVSIDTNKDGVLIVTVNGEAGFVPEDLL
jgi:Tfp pilus assembly protein PilO